MDMDIKKFKRELNIQDFPIHGECNFCDWLLLWTPFCNDCLDKFDEKTCRYDHAHCNHLIEQKGEDDIILFKDKICEDYLNSMNGPLDSNYSTSNYNHCYEDNKTTKKVDIKIFSTNDKYRNVVDESSRTYIQGHGKKSNKRK